jgi:hypothetical protein
VLSVPVRTVVREDDREGKVKTKHFLSSTMSKLQGMARNLLDSKIWNFNLCPTLTC